jgi:hypothetical protein
VVPRTRFAPVKTTSDLFVLRSDAYTIKQDCTVAAAVDPVGNLVCQEKSGNLHMGGGRLS